MKDAGFGPLVKDWSARYPFKTEDHVEAVSLCLRREQAEGLPYLLFAGVASAISEAGSTHALLLVHSFSADNSGFAEFQRFAATLGVNGARNRVSDPAPGPRAQLRLAWVADRESYSS